MLLLIAALAVAAPRGPTAIAGAALLVALASCVTAYIAAAPVAGLNLRRCLSAIAGPLLLAAVMYLLLHLMRTWAGMASLSAFVRGLAFVSVGAMVYVAGAYFLARPALLSLIRAEHPSGLAVDTNDFGGQIQ